MVCQVKHFDNFETCVETLAQRDPLADVEKRYRALFSLLSHPASSEVEAVAVVRACRLAYIGDSASDLLKHEACYVLGQIAAKQAVRERQAGEAPHASPALDEACAWLTAVLLREDESEIVRHEAAEALAAVGDRSMGLAEARRFANEFYADEAGGEAAPGRAGTLANIASLGGEPMTSVASVVRCGVRCSFAGQRGGDGSSVPGDLAATLALAESDGVVCGGSLPEELRCELPALFDTCALALSSLSKNGSAGKAICGCFEFGTVDPAFGRDDAVPEKIAEYGEGLLDVGRSLHARYEDLFTLRDLLRESEDDELAQQSEAVSFLTRALLKDRSSVVLRHEVAFVMGQLKNCSESREALKESVSSPNDEGMVRHESAIALGAIGGATKFLQEWSKHEEADQLLQESCMSALATEAYWQYWANLEASIRDSD